MSDSAQPYQADQPLVPAPPRPESVPQQEWDDNLSEPARYGGESADRSRERAALDDDGEAAHRFREILVQTNDLEWVEKTLAGLTHKALWRNEDTGASISLVRFQAGSGIPSRHSHASNQFMFCLSGRYTYVPTGITLTPGSFYWNPKGSLHGPTRAEEESVLVEVYDGPHYPTQPDWYTSADDAR
jgi:quercetin dioxygenase-like cupin family protein